MDPQPGTSRELSSNAKRIFNEIMGVDVDGGGGCSKSTKEIEPPLNDGEGLEKKVTEEIDDKLLCEIVNAEEYLEHKGAGLLEYEKQIFLDMVHSDALCVCAKGIGYEKVMINLIKVHCHQSKLILVINSSDYEERTYKRLLGDEIIHDLPAAQNERQQVYREGGVVFISTQALVVDLLKKRIPIESVIGIFVLRAHIVIESCQEAFALRLYRQQNKTGFIKAFSSSAEAFTYGYGHVEKVMRNLFIRQLFIWPRFHATIQQTLKKFEPQVIELHVPMTTKMTTIQTHILDLMNYTVREIKHLNRFLDLQEITVENCVTKKFHKILQAQLDTVWHQLSSHTKLLVSDLKVLRNLMISTIYHDCVSLFSTMRKYRTQEYAMQNSGWILLDSAEQMFKATKDRVFNAKGEFEPELPAKWNALSEILRVEIPADLKNNAATTKITNLNTDPIKVLILCSDNRTCYQLNQFLTEGGERYLFYMAIKNDVQITKISDKYKNCADMVDVVKVDGAKPSSDPFLKPTIPSDSSKSSSMIPKAPPIGNEKKKTFLIDRLIEKAEESKKVEDDLAGLLGKKDDESVAVEDDRIIFKDFYVLTMTQMPDDSKNNGNHDVDELNASLFEKAEFESFIEMENLDITSMVRSLVTPTVCIRTFKSDQCGIVNLEQTLSEINPRYVIMYHSNVTAIRQIEIFEARQNRRAEHRLKVFFLLHSRTVEEQSYLTILRREKQAFELLIDTKSSMVVPEYQDGKSDDLTLLANKTAEEEQISTRNAGGQQLHPDEKKTPQIIVDIREFRSDLPCLIHKRGIEVVPVMITIGDYILTPEICVERKSISDLIGSLNSGRLYNQCVQMSRFYTKPILLIEFDQNKPFHLQGHYMISSDATSNTDITHKIQLLTLHFPKLKLVWSPSPYATAKLFEELKIGKPEPDTEKIAAIDNMDAEVLTDKFNTTIHDFLLKLPGINPNNVGKLLRSVSNFKELNKKSEDELEILLNGKQNAKMFWEILHLNHKPKENDTNEKMHLLNRKYGSSSGSGGIRGRRKFK